MADNLKVQPIRWVVAHAYIGTPPALQTFYIDMVTIDAYSVALDGAVTIYGDNLRTSPTAYGLEVEDTMYELQNNIVQILPIGTGASVLPGIFTSTDPILAGDPILDTLDPP
jgi:hypothetical protein